MKVELDGTALDQTETSPVGGISEARSISNIASMAKRNYVRQDIPGMEGSVFQDMGRTAVLITFDGAVTGKNAKNVIEMLRSRFKSGEPVSFNSDISGTSDITKVVIDDFKVTDVAGRKDYYDYRIALKEYKAP